VSPSNILISFDGEVKLCDFGLAGALGRTGERRFTSDAMHAHIRGKSAYMAPEHARGERVDARSDVFSAGIVLWELCAGRRYNKGSEDEMLERARRGEVPKLPERGLPNEQMLQDILDRSLAAEPSARCSAAEMLLALEQYTRASAMMASQLRFGEFLTSHFAEHMIKVRRARERAAEALMLGPAATIVPVDDVASTENVPDHRTDEPTEVERERPRDSPARTSRVWILAGVGAAVAFGAAAWLAFWS